MEKKLKYLLSFDKMHLYSKKYLIKYPKLRKDIMGPVGLDFTGLNVRNKG